MGATLALTWYFLQALITGKRLACPGCFMKHRGPGLCLPPTGYHTEATQHSPMQRQTEQTWQADGMMLEVCLSLSQFSSLLLRCDAFNLTALC